MAMVAASGVKIDACLAAHRPLSEHNYDFGFTFQPSTATVGAPLRSAVR